MIKIEKRRTPQVWTTVLVGVVAITISLIFSTILLQIMGYNAVEVFSESFKKTYFTIPGILENTLMLIPLSLCALSVAVAAKAGLWNIGVDGQFLVGALVATGVALAFPNLPQPFIFILMFSAGMIAAGLLCYISVLPRVYFGISEILTTILMNSVVLYFVRYLVYDAWKDPGTVAAQTPEISAAAKLPILIPGSRVHLGLIVAILVVILIHYFINKTISGYEMRAVGDNARGAKYAGINVKKYFFIAMLLSGCLAGIAGMLEISGVVHRLQPTISADYGFSAFVIAWVARLDTVAILIISYLFAGLVVAGFKMQMMGFPASVTFMLKGLILILVLAGEMLTYYKISWVKKSSQVNNVKNGASSLEEPNNTAEGGY
ncbi:MAG: ABC transporter permease [Bacillota bacterium]|jgi:ABC-type uncharacterized transport system permease subunit